MYLKIMNSDGGFDVHDVSECRFERRGGASFVVFRERLPTARGSREEELRGRAYLMNERGDTVETFGPNIVGRVLS